jgi:hypothetical protein
MADIVLNKAASEMSNDNLTVVILCFKNLEAFYCTRPTLEKFLD